MVTASTSDVTHCAGNKPSPESEDVTTPESHLEDLSVQESDKLPSESTAKATPGVSKETLPGAAEEHRDSESVSPTSGDQQAVKLDTENKHDDGLGTKQNALPANTSAQNPTEESVAASGPGVSSDEGVSVDAKPSEAQSNPTVISEEAGKNTSNSEPQKQDTKHKESHNDANSDESAVSASPVDASSSASVPEDAPSSATAVKKRKEEMAIAEAEQASPTSKWVYCSFKHRAGT